MQKLYCYVDETGQDTFGVLFLVAIVIVAGERENLRNLLRQIEKTSGKITRKWTNTTLSQKQTYLSEFLRSKRFQGAIFYQTFAHTTDYQECTIEGVAQALAKKVSQDYKATVIIDSLGKREGKAIGTKLRQRGIHVEKVRGLPHRSDEFIRLADAMAGFTRDYLEGAAYALSLYRRAEKMGIIKQL